MEYLIDGQDKALENRIRCLGFRKVPFIEGLFNITSLWFVVASLEYDMVQALGFRV